ncbi:ABC transporter ATP-binding protein [Mobilicoccus caccae]|uniref:ABC transporter ATP-binding protein n=2 Tax=Mobilicoccus caccae TaxID=1859295 RepID=A0ABQ6IW02_9MICO|nr:ABC transporter ATP-binding protein [Mobilicoccus caccae]
MTTPCRAPEATSSGRLRLADVDVSIGRTVIVHGADLEARPGEVTVLVGPNGSGKSTLLRSIFRACRAEGVMTLDDLDLTRLGRRDLARRLTALTQEQMPAAGPTVREVVGLGRMVHLGDFSRPGARDREIVEESMRATEVDHLADRDCASLSGGERQRTHVARALAQRTGVVVMDEPTNHLDIHHQVRLLELLRASAEDGHTVLVALHDLTLAAVWADHVVMMRAGRVLRHGPPREVLTPEHVRDCFGVNTTWVHVAGRDRLVVV